MLTVLSRPIAAIAVFALALSAAPEAVPHARRQTPSIQTVLRAVGTYLDSYEHDLSAVTAEEDYVQKISNAYNTLTTRHLQSDIVFMTDADQGWLTIRDVYNVDGQPVRDHDERLAALFAQPGSTKSGSTESGLTKSELTTSGLTTSAQGRAIAEESARFNLNVNGVSVGRTLNVPMVALVYFQTQAQSRSKFKLVRMDTSGGQRAAVVDFDEQAKPRLISSTENIPMHGRAWIEPESGRVLETELSYVTSGRNARTTATIHVVYAEDPRLHLWLAASMDERYEATPSSPQTAAAIVQLGLTSPVLTGHATYSDFRRFEVDTGISTTPQPRP